MGPIPEIKIEINAGAMPTGARGFASGVLAKNDAVAAGKTSFAVIMQQQAFKNPEYAWVSPVDVFVTRMPRAVEAGIALIEMVHA